jgi:lytic murein transglycosylase
VRREIFDQAVHGLQLDLSIPDLALPRDPGRSKGQAEFAKPPSEYLSEPSLAHLAAEGRALAAKHRDLLAAIHHRFGTPPPIILAIWGRETAFGSYRLPHNAMRVLATQAYMGRRSDFFYNEFLLALRLLNEGHVRLNDMHSSWAGAMGPTQFLPSDFYKFAVDFDGDGRADVWNSLPDALASAAKQLVDYGWERDKPWGFEVFPRSTPDCTLSLPTFKRPVKEWLANGFGPNDGALSSWLDEPASLVMPAGNLGPAFLGLRNYDAIRSYNNSDVYVLFVGNLADRIGGSGAFKGRWMPVPPVTAMDVEKMQTALGDLGLYKGKADGQAGPLTRVAIGIYQKSHNLHLTCWPDSRILTHISSRNQ